MSKSSIESRTRTYQLIIFGVLFVGYATYGLNRKGVSLVLADLIKNGLDKSDAGLIISSQNIAYAISKFIGGILSDRLSPKLLFSFGLLFSGLATILFGLSPDSVLLFSVLWFCNGFAQGFGWPSCAKLLRHWFSPEQFGTFWSLLSASANISGGLSPLGAAFLTINYGWRTTLIVFGVISVLMSLVGLIVIVNTPQDIGLPIINQNAAPVKKSDDKNDITWIDLIKSPFVLFISFCYLIVFAAKSSACDWGQLYLIEELGKSQFVGSSFTSSIEIGGFFGGISAGYLTDKILKAQKKNSRPTISPRFPVAIVMIFVAFVCLHLLCFSVSESSSQIFISLLGMVLGACLYGPIAIFGVVACEQVPPNLSGTSHAIAALAANVGAIIAGLPFSILAERYSWGSVFFLLEVLMCVTFVAMLIGRTTIVPNFHNKLK